MFVETAARRYLDCPYESHLTAVVREVRDGWCSLSATVFFPGGGGQPPDTGSLQTGERQIEVSSVREDELGEIWHQVGEGVNPGDRIVAQISWPRRYALMRHHTLLHIVNALIFRQFGGLITGVQIGTEQSRIDFKVDGFTRDHVAEFERCMDAVVTENRQVLAATISQAEFRSRPDLVRTLEVAPPVVGDCVRVVEISGFDVQACGGTHVHRTGELGSPRVVRMDNKGRINKRIYLSLPAAQAPT